MTPVVHGVGLDVPELDGFVVYELDDEVVVGLGG